MTRITGLISFTNLLLALAIFYTIIPTALADTEIINFHFPLAAITALAVPPNVTSLGPSEHPAELVISHLNPELWILLDPKPGITAWTARISWPASSPTKFALSVHAIGQDDDTAAVLLHITASALSPRMRHPGLAAFGWPSRGGGDIDSMQLDDNSFRTQFHLVFEPLVLGFLPQTSLSLLGPLLSLVIGALCVVPYITRAIERIIVRVDREEQQEPSDAARHKIE